VVCVWSGVLEPCTDSLWEPNVQAECDPGELPQPLQYITTRIHNPHDLSGRGGDVTGRGVTLEQFAVEERKLGKCMCQHIVNSLVNVSATRPRPFTMHFPHLALNCPHRTLICPHRTLNCPHRTLNCPHLTLNRLKFPHRTLNSPHSTFAE
jgi:hypothetical protein